MGSLGRDAAWERLVSALNVLPDAVIIIDSAGVVRWVNTRCRAVAPGAPWSTLELSGEPEAPSLRQIAAKAEPWQGEALLRSPDGTAERWQCHVAPLSGPPEFLCTLHPVVRQEKFALPIDVIPQMVLIHRLISNDRGEAIDYTFEDVNCIFEAATGLRREALRHRLGSDFWRRPSPPFLEEYAAVVRTQKPKEFEKCAGDSERVFAVSAIPLGGDLLAVVAKDVTESNRAEKDFQREKAFNAAILDSIPGLFYVYNAEGRLIRWNSQMEKMTGYSGDDLLHHHVLDWWDDKWKQVIADGIRRALAEGRASTEAVARTKSGDELPLQVTAVRMSVGEEVYITGIGLDLTERRKSELERARLEAQLAQAQRMESVGKLAGGIAHDFNNLLTIINGYSDYLLDSIPAGNELREPVEAIAQAGARAADLTGQLLAFSRKQVFEPKPVDVNAVVRDVSTMLGRLIGEDIEVSIALDDNLGPAMADAGQVHQVLVNLIVNARDAMPTGGRLSITTASIDFAEHEVADFSDALPGPYVEISVTDSGVGMDEETRQRVFEPFFTTKGLGKGTGLGLATVYGIVRQSGGWIWVRSSPGNGSAFRVYLPRIKACPMPESNAALAIAADGPAEASETILIVEDQEGVRNLTRKMLTARGYRTLEAADGEQALRISADLNQAIDLMITDVVLPGMNGRQLADALSLSRPEMKVLFMSGYSANVIAEKGVLGPDVAYLPKPFTADALNAKVRILLDQ